MLVNTLLFIIPKNNLQIAEALASCKGPPQLLEKINRIF